MMDSSGPERTVKLLGREWPRDEVVARVFYLFFFASYGSLYPLLAVYFKQLGMAAGQAGLLLGCRPLIEFAAQPFWGMFGARFKKGKLLLMFSLASLIVSTLAIGFVQPVTPFCVVLDRNSTGGQCMLLAPAGEVIRGGAIGYLREATGIGRKKREASNQIIDRIIDLSSYDREEDIVAGWAPEYITRDKVCNYDENVFGVLVSPPHSTRVYRKPAVEQTFMLLLVLVVLGEFFSSPAIALADGCTLNVCADNPKQFGRIRLFGSFGWGLAMFVIGIGLDYSDTFRNHPCPTKNTTEKNYTLCFVTCSVFMGLAMAVATQFKFGQGEEHRTDEVGGLVIDTRIDEVDPAVAEKARARQLTSNYMNEGSAVMHALKAMANIHVMLHLACVVTIGIGAGIIFAFLFWHLQDLGGSPVLFGIASIINHGSEIAAFFYTFQVINKFGHTRVMYMCLGANIVRFLVISWLSNPWMVLPLQVMQGCVLALVWASASSYISLISPPHLKSTSQMILQFLYQGLGKGVGSILGGFIISSVGTRATFQIYVILVILVLTATYAASKLLGNSEGFKYGMGNFEEEDCGDALAPQGMPMHLAESKITDAFNQSSVGNANYGAIGPDPTDPTQDAYDRYVSNPSY
ncbi:hypothetical protein QR680_012826 [Steinernema hermaphroditum]|uniref:Major facilitator superfamily associated domain-containing protein n=1 Tax=Steinernema hermaphroditum TaxID=289476 RepID=A0AA39I507_9BILA|nr:hypothetical protein QR680_012826 [Steinernema hermaphroditum]